MNEQKKEYIETEIKVVKARLKKLIEQLNYERHAPVIQEIIDLQNLIFSLEKGEGSTYEE